MQALPLFPIRHYIRATVTAAFLSQATLAAAHVTLESGQANAGTFYKAVLRVPHGCDGAPTVRLRVRIPNGIESVKPQPKPGWKLATVKERLAKPLEGENGRKITEVVQEISWSGGRLADEEYDEFAFQVRLPDTPGTTLYFPVVQECAKGVNRWIEIPAAAQTSRDLKQPAPALHLGPKG